MTDSEFISSTHELRTLALRTGSALVGTSCGEDIAQDAMLRLWNMRSDIRSAAHGRGLAVSISRHLAVDYLRRHKVTAVTLWHSAHGGKPGAHAPRAHGDG